MATWREFLEQVRNQVIANKADSGWIPLPHDPDVLVYCAWLGLTNEDILCAIIAKEGNKDFVYHRLTLINPKSNVELIFSTAEDAKLVHKLMIDEEKRYAAWDKANPPPPPPIDLGVVTIKSAADLEHFINRITTLINPAANLQQQTREVKGDSSKVKN